MKDDLVTRDVGGIKAWILESRNATEQITRALKVIDDLSKERDMALYRQTEVRKAAV